MLVLQNCAPLLDLDLFSSLKDGLAPHYCIKVYSSDLIHLGLSILTKCDQLIPDWYIR